jgi:hypothetical protein
MGLAITGRKAATRVMAARYARATKAERGAILDELCSLTGWTPPRPQGHLRRRARASSSGEARPVVYDPEVVDALRKVWIVMGAPAGSVSRSSFPESSPRSSVTASCPSMPRCGPS